MWQSTVLICMLFALTYGQQPKNINDKIIGLLRKYVILNFDEATAHHQDDVDVVRSLKTDHFLSKVLMPSNIPGQKDKCWNNCENGNINMKTQLLDNLPAKYWINEKTTTQPPSHRKTNNPKPKRKLKQKKRHPRNFKNKSPKHEKRSANNKKKTRRMANEVLNAPRQQKQAPMATSTNLVPVRRYLDEKTELQKGRVLQKAEGFLRELRRMLDSY